MRKILWVGEGIGFRICFGNQMDYDRVDRDKSDKNDIRILMFLRKVLRK
jgi:hypothetical protein